MSEPRKPIDDFFPDLRAQPPRQGMRARLVWTAGRILSALMRLAFYLLYYPLSFTYDAVAWIVSAGEWADWRRCVFPSLPPGRVLELAHGTGTLALEMAQRGYSVAAVDLSPAMGKIALRKKRKWSSGRWRRGLPAAGPELVRADVRRLPFQKEVFSSAVSTFPADFIFMPRTLQEVHRTLRPGGRWIILPTAFPEWLAGRVLPQEKAGDPHALSPILIRHLEEAGFSARAEIVRRPRSRVLLILAEKPGVPA